MEQGVLKILIDICIELSDPKVYSLTVHDER